MTPDAFDVRSLWRLTLWFTVILAVTLLTHAGDHSPYTYGWAALGRNAHGTLDGYAFNPDNYTIIPLTNFFYQPSPPDFSQVPNVLLPAHSFFISVLLGLTRSYMFSAYLVNLLFGAFVFYAYSAVALRHGIPARVIGFAGTLILSLPYFAHYMGQPMHYIVGPAITFLIVMAMMLIDREEATSTHRHPSWYTGFLAGFLLINYDWYVALPAVLAYVCWFRRPKSLPIFFGTVLFMRVLWGLVLSLGDAELSATAANQFFTPIRDGWLLFLTSPVDHWIRPWLFSMVGWNVAVAQISSYFYWFMLIALVILTALLRPDFRQARSSRLPLLLLAFFVAAQLAIAALDWETNPRRALPLLVPYAYWLTWAVWATWQSRRFRLMFIALGILSYMFTFSDTLFHNPGIALSQIGQAIHGGPKYILQFETVRLDSQLPHFIVDTPLQLFGYPHAAFDSDFQGIFLATQAFMFLSVGLLLFIFGRIRLLPYRTAEVWGAVFAISIVGRFILLGTS